MADDELEVIQAIFCQPGELRVTHGDDGSNQVDVRLKPAAPDHEGNDEQPLSLDAELGLFLPSAYPSQPPDVSVRSDTLSRKDITRLRMVLIENVSQSIDQPMLLDLITLASEELVKIVEEQKKDLPRTSVNSDDLKNFHSQSVPSESRLALLHLDHMRAKTQYVKLIKKWAADLSLNGCLVFCQRLILIVLQGPSFAIKEYTVRQRTGIVDVDSKGRPCKERMLSVLYDIPVASHHCRFDNFRVVELNSAEDLKQFFTKWCLQDEFLEHVTVLKQFPGR
ncbi:hypothetical protein ACOMHN_017642 [Nucella lapillus]